MKYSEDEKIPLYSMVKSLSTAMDLISRNVVGHNKRVAYIAHIIGREMKLKNDAIKELVLAALLHDIGVFYLNINYADLSFDKSNDTRHAEVGYHLLKEHFPLNSVSEIIRYHHHYWEQKGRVDRELFELSSIIFLADRIEILIEDKMLVLEDAQKIKTKIKENSGTLFWPEAVEAFLKASTKESFWLDIVNDRQIERHFYNYSYIFNDILNIDQAVLFSNVYSHLIDFRSPFTAAHSQIVAAVAVEIARLIGFDKMECKFMKIASLTHDIGKLKVPVEILNKPGELNHKEWSIMKSHSYYSYLVLIELGDYPKMHQIRNWAALHHEKLNGSGYPFHMKGDSISTGSRIMAVSDIFTALIEDRPYRKEMSQERVKKILSNMIENNLLDRKIVNIAFDNYKYLYKIIKETRQDILDYYISFRKEVGSDE